MTTNSAQYKEFVDYLSLGAQDILKNNQDNLEKYLREAIDIKKAEKVVSEYRKHDDNTTISPELFLAFSLVDNIPEKVDLRFTPEFMLDGIVFKYLQKISRFIAPIKVPYNQQVTNLLKLQISPDAEIEMSRSMGYAQNIINRLKLFHAAYIKEILNYNDSLFNILHSSLNEKCATFFRLIISSMNNTDRNFVTRISHIGSKTSKVQLEFCSKFIKNINESKAVTSIDNEYLYYHTIYTIVLNKLFPGLSPTVVQKIFDTCMDMDNHINYKDVGNWISLNNHRIHPYIYKTIDKCKAKARKKQSYRERFIEQEVIYKSIDRLHRILSAINKKDVYKNTHNFFNFVMIVNVHRKHMEMQIHTGKQYIHPMTPNEINKRCHVMVDLEKIRAWGENNSHIPLQELYPTLMNDLNKMCFHKNLPKDIGINWDRFNYDVFKTFLKSLHPTVRRISSTTKKVGEPYEPHADFIKLMDESQPIKEFCFDSLAYSIPSGQLSGPPYEITSETSLGSINNIGGANFLAFIFKDQVKRDFFNDVEYVLFHEQLIVVSKKGTLHNLTPNDAYKRLVLSKFHQNIEVALSPDHDNIQLERFRAVLKTVLTDKRTEHFEDSNGGDFVESLQKSTSIRFINKITRENDGMIQEHELNWGNISKVQQDHFIHLLEDLSFIFPKIIPEIHLNILPLSERMVIPDNEKDLLFFIEGQRDAHSNRNMTKDFSITQEDLFLLARSNRFYTTIIIERAFAVVYNRLVMDNPDNLSSFKDCIGKLNLAKAINHFAIRGESFPENRILRKMFIQNSLLFLRADKKLSPQMIEFFTGIYSINPQLKLN